MQRNKIQKENTKKYKTRIVYCTLWHMTYSIQFYVICSNTVRYVVCSVTQLQEKLLTVEAKKVVFAYKRPTFTTDYTVL